MISTLCLLLFQLKVTNDLTTNTIKKVANIGVIILPNLFTNLLGLRESKTIIKMKRKENVNKNLSDDR